jgi:hypothetical protein
MTSSRTLAAALVLVAAWGTDAGAQRIIYDSKGDQTAQQAVTAAGQVTSDALFDLMLRNVDAQSSIAADTEMAFVEQQMRAKLQAFIVWHHKDAIVGAPISGGLFLAGDCKAAVRCELETVQKRLSTPPAASVTAADITNRLNEIKKRQAELTAAIEALAASKAKEPAIVEAFALLRDPGKDVIDGAQKLADLVVKNGTLSGDQQQLAKGVVGALGEIEKGVDQALALFNAIKGIWDGYKGIQVDPASLRPPQEKIDLKLLAVERDHLKAKARILARQQIEVAAALAQVDGVLARLRSMKLDDLQERIDVTIAAATTAKDTERVFQLVRVLHDAAAVVAQVDAAKALAAYRLADEERRYAIRQSAVNTSTYDLTIQAAVQRLAKYWKGGIKPTELAQFAFFLSNTFAIPAIAAKQE